MKIEVRDLEKYLGGTPVLRGITLEFPKTVSLASSVPTAAENPPCFAVSTGCCSRKAVLFCWTAALCVKFPPAQPPVGWRWWPSTTTTILTLR